MSSIPRLHPLLQKMIEQICINKNVYSDDEVIVGYALKNKKKIPVYRKYVSGTFTSSKRTDITLFGKVDELIKVYGSWSPESVGIMGYGSDDLTTDGEVISRFSVRKTGANNILIRESSQTYNGYTGWYKLYIEYTKITDL